MNVEIQDEGDSGSGQAIAFTVGENEEVHVLHPSKSSPIRVPPPDGRTG